MPNTGLAITDIIIPNIAIIMAPRASLAAIVSLVPFVGLLAWLSLSSTLAVFSALPSIETVSSAERQIPVPPEELKRAASANMRSGQWFEGSRYRLHAARTLLALPPTSRVGEQASIEKLTRSSLSASPMSSYGWTLLSFLRFARGDVPNAVRAWNMSVLVGRYVPNLMQSRLLLGMSILRHDPSLAQSVTDQIHLLAEADPASLARTARHGGIEAPVRALLAGAEQSAHFERATNALIASVRSRAKQQSGAKL